MVLMYTCDLDLLHAILNDNKRTRIGIERENTLKAVLNEVKKMTYTLHITNYKNLLRQIFEDNQKTRIAIMLEEKIYKDSNIYIDLC